VLSSRAIDALAPAIGAANYSRPVAVIGDIHGSARQLRALLERLRDTPILVLGDLCDHGPDTREVLDLLIERQARGVRGNHDEWFLTWACGAGFYGAVLQQGAAATLSSYGVHATRSRQILAERDRVPPSHLAFLRGLHVALDLTVMGQRYWLTHAGLPRLDDYPDAPREDVVRWLAEHVPDALVWGMSSPRPIDMPTVDRPLVMGHVNVAEPIDTPAVIAINTGAGDPGGRLTAVVLPHRTFITISDDA
jgi:serine/threonine protein phosphatase 1